MKPSGPGFFFVGKFWITNIISLLIIDLFRFSISFWVSLGIFWIASNLSIYSRLSSSLVFIVLVYNPFYLCKVGRNIPIFLSDFTYLCPGKSTFILERNNLDFTHWHHWKHSSSMNQAKWSSFPSVHSHLGPAMINFHFYSPSRPNHLCQYLLSDLGKSLFPLDPHLTQGGGTGCLDALAFHACAHCFQNRGGFIPGRPTLRGRGATPDLLAAAQDPHRANLSLMPA